MMKTSIILLIVMFSFQVVSKQKFYKWTDKNGNTHYSSEKPTNKTTSEVNVNTNQPVIVAPNNETQTLGAKNQEKLDTYYKKKKETKSLTKANQEKCKQAQKYLAKFQQPVRFGATNKNTGDRIYLEGNQRTQIIKASKINIRKFCK